MDCSYFIFVPFIFYSYNFLFTFNVVFICYFLLPSMYFSLSLFYLFRLVYCIAASFIFSFLLTFFPLHFHFPLVYFPFYTILLFSFPSFPSISFVCFFPSLVYSATFISYTKSCYYTACTRPTWHYSDLLLMPESSLTTLLATQLSINKTEYAIHL